MFDGLVGWRFSPGGLGGNVLECRRSGRAGRGSGRAAQLASRNNDINPGRCVHALSEEESNLTIALSIMPQWAQIGAR